VSLYSPQKSLVFSGLAILALAVALPAGAQAGLPNGELEHIWENPLDPNVAPPLGGDSTLGSSTKEDPTARDEVGDPSEGFEDDLSTEEPEGSGFKPAAAEARPLTSKRLFFLLRLLLGFFR